ncbi:MAG: DUF1700 domain-containing protein [Oscillospiraceae bacterium]
MNKKLFLSELSHYLTFTSAYEREQIIEGYTSRFDAAGEEGEAALLSELGTPMMIAITLKRRREAGENICDIVEAPPSEVSPQAAAETAPSPAPEQPTEPKGESLPVADEAPLPTGDPLPVDAAPPPIPQPLSYENISVEIEELNSESFDQDDIIIEKPLPAPPKQSKHIVSTIFGGLLALLIGVVFLALAAVGVCFVAAMFNLFMCGLQLLSTPTNSLLLFGGGLIFGAVGLVIIWLAAWAAITIITRLFAAINRRGLPVLGKERDA